MADPDENSDLRERVAELEQTVAQQQATIQKLLPGRRSVLKGAALLGGGALVGAGTADRASAQASGQVGTSSDPVDVEAYDLAVQNQLSSNVDAGGNDLTNVGSVNTTELFTEPAGARLTQDTSQSISSGSLTQLEWDSATEFNSGAGSFADLTDDRVVIPSSEYSFARATLGFRMNTRIPIEQIRFVISGGVFGTPGVGRFDPRGVSMRGNVIGSGWFPVSDGDGIEVQFEHSSGTTEGTDPAERDTFFEVWAL